MASNDESQTRIVDCGVAPFLECRAGRDTSQGYPLVTSIEDHKDAIEGIANCVKNNSSANMIWHESQGVSVGPLADVEALRGAVRFAPEKRP